MSETGTAIGGTAIGFIGLGVMGEPMCRNLAILSGRPVVAFDNDPAAVERLRDAGVTAAADLQALAVACDVIFMALPSGRHVEEVCRGWGLLEYARRGTLIVDCGTSPVELTRDLAAQFVIRGRRYVDAPIARTRQAAIDGILSFMVGASDADFCELQPLLAVMGADITHCGPVGCGQIAKIMNNMVLVQTVVALSEAAAVAERAGLKTGVLFETLMKGSADSFALRNHGMKAILPGEFPERAFSVAYAQKDLGYALELAKSVGAELPGASTAAGLLASASAAGFGNLYWPVVSRLYGSHVVELVVDITIRRGDETFIAVPWPGNRAEVDFPKHPFGICPGFVLQSELGTAVVRSIDRNQSLRGGIGGEGRPSISVVFRVHPHLECKHGDVIKCLVPGLSK
jgi:3-hydroxyisobutyrate dehydrogenase-like beta-hydroxyacid dehydrogenase